MSIGKREENGKWLRGTGWPGKDSKKGMPEYDAPEAEPRAESGASSLLGGDQTGKEVQGL